MTINSTENGFYIPPSRLKYITAVEQLTSDTGVVAIEGASGMGKTTVLEEVLTSALPNANKCYLTITASINDIQVRSRIIEQLFGNVLFDPEKPLLNAFLEFSKNDGQLIAIDNAHWLSGQLVGELLQVVAEFKKQHKQLSLLVSFDKKISNTLSSINSALISVMPIPALTNDESYTLLSQYFSDLPSATNTKIKRWIENSQGNPIQLLAFEKSDNFAVVSGTEFNLKLWISSLIALSAVIALSVYGYRHYIDVPEQPPKPITESAIKSRPEPVVQDWSAAKLKKQSIETSDSKPANKSKAEALELASTKDMFTALANSMAEQPIKKVDVDDSLIPQKEAQTRPQSDIAEVIDETESKREFDSEFASSEDENKETENRLAEVSPNVSTEITPIQPVDPKQTPKQNEAAEKVVPTNNSKTTIEPLKVAGYVINNQQMLALPSNKFVLQLTAVSTESTLAEYLQDARPDIKLTRIYKISRNNSDWLVVTYGLFDTIASARKAAIDVDKNAWAKSVNVIQQQIRTFNESLSQ